MQYVRYMAGNRQHQSDLQYFMPFWQAGMNEWELVDFTHNHMMSMQQVTLAQPVKPMAAATAQRCWRDTIA